MMKRDECLSIIEDNRGSAVIVAHFQPAFDLIRIAPNPLNWYAVGAMGQAAPHGIGLALGLPDRKVIVLDGDGSLLMNLGTLATAIEAVLPNFIHFVCENGCYETNGSHPLPAAGRVDFCMLARGAGYRRVFNIETLDELRARLPEILSQNEPVFARLRVESGECSTEDWSYVNGEAARQRFRDAVRRT
jgi:phosphonopyruvate decarboxylase